MNRNQYNLVEPHRYYWEALEKTGSLDNIPESVLLTFQNVAGQILDVKYNLACKNCVIEMIQFLGLRFKKYEQSVEA